MKDVLELLKEQNRLLENHNNLFEASLSDNKRLLELQAAELRVNNSRTAIISSTLEKLLIEVSRMGAKSQKLLDELGHK